MRILIVSSGNSGKTAAFVSEQAVALIEEGASVEHYSIIGKGIFGYLKNFPAFSRKIKEFRPDIIHAHYGLSGALAVLQRKIPVVTTFHDGETHNSVVNLISSFAAIFSVYNIFVAQHIFDLLYLKKKKKSTILPCGVSYKSIQLVDKEIAITELKLSRSKKNILFGGAFDNLRKNYPLLQQAIILMHMDNINVIEMKNLNRDEITLLMCACDIFVLPTKREGSPQALKEAMLCNCPIVATDVADIRSLLADTEGCYICSYDPKDLADKLLKALAFNKRTNGREKLNYLDNTLIAKHIIQIYKDIINEKCVE